MRNDLKPIIIFICTPSPFREYILQSCKKEEDFLIYESKKNFKVNYETTTEEETKISYKLFKSKLIKNNLYNLENINDEKLFEIISSIEGKKYIVLSGANFIKNYQLQKINRIPKLMGIFNIHFGNCLTYRGLDSNLWACYHEEFHNIGVSLHEVNCELDKGDLVIYRQLSKFKDIKDLKYKEILLAKEILNDFRMRIDNNDPITKIKNNGLGRYYGAMPSCLKQVVFKKIWKNLK